MEGRSELLPGLEQFATGAEVFLHLADVAQHTEAGDRFDAAHAGGNRRLLENLEEAELGGVVCMGAAAELDGASADIDHADDVTVFFREKRHRALGLRLLLTHLGDGDRQAGKNQTVDQHLDLHQLVGGDSGEMGKVEAAAVGVNQLSGLVHMASQHLAQRILKQMGGGMVAP